MHHTFQSAACQHTDLRYYMYRDIHMHYKAYCSRSDTKLTEKELKRELVGVRSSIHVKKSSPE